MKGARPLFLAVFAALLIAATGSAYYLESGLTRAQSSVAAKKSARASATGHLVDLNSATREQLDSLPGIGGVYSQKIINGRPYKAKTDLVRRHIIPESTYNKISNLVVARQPATHRGR